MSALLPIFALALAYACAGTQLYRDNSLGSKLYYSRCRSCHSSIDPASKTDDFWTNYLDRYAERAQLSEPERDSVMAFVLRATENSEQ
jgi:hypothetical protein